MSAPNTNIEKQKKRHKGPLGGIWFGLAFVAVLLVVWLGYVFMSADEDEPAAATTEPAAVTETDAGTDAAPVQTETEAGTEAAPTQTDTGNEAAPMEAEPGTTEDETAPAVND